jgi:hypothetical protein
MSGKLFIERRDEEGDYAIRRLNADRISDHEATQADAIERAREIDPNAAILVERVRHTDKGYPDKWRRP